MAQRGGGLLRRQGTATPRRMVKSGSMSSVKEEQEEWEPSYCMPVVRPVRCKTSLLDFFRVPAGEEREVLLRTGLAGTGVLSSAAEHALEQERRWSAMARTFTPRTWKTRRQKLRDACRAKLRRAVRKLRIINALSNKPGSGGGKNRAARPSHQLHRILYLVRKETDSSRRVL